MGRVWLNAVLKRRQNTSCVRNAFVRTLYHSVRAESVCIITQKSKSRESQYLNMKMRQVSMLWYRSEWYHRKCSVRV